MMELTSPSSLISDIRIAYDPVHNTTSDCFINMVFQENQSATNIWKYFPPVLIVCGTIGNALSIAVFRLPEMRSLPITQLLITLAILDIVVLTFTLTPKWLNYGLQLIDYNLNISIGYVWEIQIWLAQSVGMVDHWLMVFVSIDRAFSVFRPLSTWVGRYKSMSGRIRFGTLCLVCALLNSYVIYDFAWHSKKEKRVSLEYTFEYRICELDSSHKRVMGIWRVWTMVITFLVPFVIIVLVNTAILCKLQATCHGRWYREETQQKRAKAATVRVNVESDEADRRKKKPGVRERKEIENEGTAGRRDSVMKREGNGQREQMRKRKEGKREVQRRVELEEKEIKEEEKQPKNGSREEKGLVDEKPSHTRFDVTAELRSTSTVCQAKRNIRVQLVVNTVFLVTDLPIVTYITIFFFLDITQFSSSFLEYTICDHMMYLRHTFSFFVFGISEQFRSAVLRLITKSTVKQTWESQEPLEISLGDQRYQP